MHSWEHGKTVFHGNSDLSGDVVICGEPDSEYSVPSKLSPYPSLTIPFDDLLAFVGGRLGFELRALMDKIDDVDGPTLLKILASTVATSSPKSKKKPGKTAPKGVTKSRKK